MNKILLLGSQHGNELLGEHLYGYIQRARPELLLHIDYQVGNLRAKRRQVRYIESDLNRSYGGKRDTYEQRRAQRILRTLRRESYAIVLDLHTTTCLQPPCFIVADIATNRQFLRASSIVNIAQMNHEIVMSSLIGNFPQAVSIEINKDEAQKSQTLENLCDDIARFLAGKALDQLKQIYTVNALLKKTEISPKDATSLQNFTRSKYGFYPILVGENSYKKQTEYLGFKASHLVVSKV